MNIISAEEILHAILPDSGETCLIDLLRREIWVSGPIYTSISRTFIRSLRQMVQFSTAPIAIFINSEGGDAYEAMAIVDAINTVKNSGVCVNTHIVGQAYSAGLLISAAGTKGHRTAAPSSDILIHSLGGGASGSVDDVVSVAKNLQRFGKGLASHLKESSNLGMKEVVSLMKAENYISAKEAKKMGFVDKVCLPI